MGGPCRLITRVPTAEGVLDYATGSASRRQSRYKPEAGPSRATAAAIDVPPGTTLLLRPHQPAREGLWSRPQPRPEFRSRPRTTSMLRLRSLFLRRRSQEYP